MAGQRNFFLDEIGKRFHRQRPMIPEGFNTTRYAEREGNRTFVNIRVRSRGCQHNYLGGCTMCDYWVANRVDAQDMIRYGREALEALDFAPTLLVFGPSGSMLDDWEVPPEARREFYRMLQSIDVSIYVFFSRAETVTADKLSEIVEYLDPAKVSIEMGLETADTWKLKYCVNKAIDIGQISDAAQLIRQFGANSTAYILVGVPFLTASEAVADSVSSVTWAFEQGVDYCVVFPVHVKPWTVVHWLYQNGLYEPVSLWALVDVLSLLPQGLLEHVGISWYAPRPDRVHPSYQIPSIPPTTCPSCYDQVLDLLESYRFSGDRAQVVNTLNGLDCKCRDNWRQKLDSVSTVSLAERVSAAYAQMGIDILGRDWWASYGENVLSNIIACI